MVKRWRKGIARW